MSEAGWYRASLVLPLIAPLLAYAVDLLVPGWEGSFAELSPIRRSYVSLLTLVVFSGVVGGVPYAVFAALLFAFLRRRSVESWRRAFLFAPVLFLPVLTLFLFIGSWWLALPLLDGEPLPLDRDTLELLGLFDLYALGLGYSYVLLGLGVGRWLRSRSSGQLSE